ncbi:ATP synthase F1 subunit epsilon [Rhodobacterales bacterium 52_120_T64]|nr:ATP synthase F1 subunit epsilon [Rhodobacterales bacterium 52_120_T64]
MADTMTFDLVSPERKLASVEATSVNIPGMEGDLTAMPNHAAFLTTLRPGVVKVNNGSDVTEYVVTGGFAEISAEGTSVLAEQAMPLNEATAEVLGGVLSAAEATLETSAEDSKTAAAQRVNDVKTLMEQLGH